jgi:acetyltransferase-like isoleucine patch superfamily enzyme
VKIKDGAWLGTNVTVMPGVTIGRNAVIGANSVVNGDVPDFATAVGAPARIL